jgi:hypothetical protein
MDGFEASGLKLQYSDIRNPLDNIWKGFGGAASFTTDDNFINRTCMINSKPKYTRH